MLKNRILFLCSVSFLVCLTQRSAFDPRVSLEPSRALALRLMPDDLAEGLSGARVVQDAGVNALLVPAAVEVRTLVVGRATDNQVWHDRAGHNCAE